MTPAATCLNAEALCASCHKPLPRRRPALPPCRHVFEGETCRRPRRGSRGKHRSREVLPVRVRDVSGCFDTPQLRRDATERRLAGVVQQIHHQYQMIGQRERGAAGDEEHPRAMAVRGHGCPHRLPGQTAERGVLTGSAPPQNPSSFSRRAWPLTSCQASSLVKSVRTRSEEFRLLVPRSRRR